MTLDIWKEDGFGNPVAIVCRDPNASIEDVKAAIPDALRDECCYEIDDLACHLELPDDQEPTDQQILDYFCVKDPKKQWVRYVHISDYDSEDFSFEFANECDLALVVRSLDRPLESMAPVIVTGKQK